MKPADRLLSLLTGPHWNKQSPASPESVAALSAAFGALPAEYEALLAFSDGGSLTGRATPFIVYSVTEVLALFREHDLYRYIPRSLVFGGDGGGTIFCFDLRPGKEQRVFFTREEEAGYEPEVYSRLVFEGTTLTDTIERVLNNEKIN